LCLPSEQDTSRLAQDALARHAMCTSLRYQKRPRYLRNQMHR
jgi:hypothetical protein